MKVVTGPENHPWLIQLDDDDFYSLPVLESFLGVLEERYEEITSSSSAASCGEQSAAPLINCMYDVLFKGKQRTWAGYAMLVRKYHKYLVSARADEGRSELYKRVAELPLRKFVDLITSKPLVQLWFGEGIAEGIKEALHKTHWTVVGLEEVRILALKLKYISALTKSENSPDRKDDYIDERKEGKDSSPSPPMKRRRESPDN